MDPHIPKYGSDSSNLVMDNPLSQNPGQISILLENLADFASKLFTLMGIDGCSCQYHCFYSGD